MNSSLVLKELRLRGWILIRTKGSHHILRSPESGNIVVVPHPKRDLPIGTVKAIERATGLKLLK